MTDTITTTAAAQVGNGKVVHQVRTDGFHMQTIGCSRPVRTVLTEQQAAKMGKTCGPCDRAVQALTVEEGPRVHRFDDTETAYDATQCSEDIRDGDVLVVESEGVVGVLTNAWPLALTEAHGEFHHAVERYRVREMNEGRYAPSADLAERAAADLGLTLLPHHRTPAAPAVEEAPAGVEEEWEPGHCTPMMGGAVHEVTSGLDGSDGGPVHIFPLCRTGSMTNQGTRYRKVKAALTCKNCISNRDRRRAAQARRAAEAAAPAAPVVEDAPAAAKRYRRTENGTTTYLTQPEGEAEIERLRAQYARDEIRELFAGSTGATYTTLGGLRIHLNLEEAPAAPVEAPAFVKGDRVLCADGLTRTVDHMKRYVADEPEHVVMECGALWTAANCKRIEQDEAAPAAQVPPISNTYRERQAREAAALTRNQQVTEAARALLLHAGHPEEAQGRAGFLFRTNWLAVQLYAVDAAGCHLAGYPLDDALDALRETLEAHSWHVDYSTTGYHGSCLVLTPPTGDAAPAPAPADQAARAALVDEISARLAAGLTWSTAAAFQPVTDGEDGPVIGWTFRTRSGSEIRYGYVAARGLILEGCNEIRHREDARRELVDHHQAGTDTAELMAPVATYRAAVIAHRSTEQLAECLHAFDVDAVKAAPEGPGRLVVTRGPDFLGTIFDGGANSRRGRYEAWAPYAGTRHNSAGFHATVEEAVAAIAHAWPVAAWELAEETGASVSDVLTASYLVADEGVKVHLRINTATGADQKFYRDAADIMRVRLLARQARAAAPVTVQAEELDEEQARKRAASLWPGAVKFQAVRDRGSRLLGYTFQVGSLHSARYGWITASGGTIAQSLEPYRSHADVLLPHAVRDERSGR